MCKYFSIWLSNFKLLLSIKLSTRKMVKNSLNRILESVAYKASIESFHFITSSTNSTAFVSFQLMSLFSARLFCTLSVFRCFSFVLFHNHLAGCISVLDELLWIRMHFFVHNRYLILTGGTSSSVALLSVCLYGLVRKFYKYLPWLEFSLIKAWTFENTSYITLRISWCDPLRRIHYLFICLKGLCFFNVWIISFRCSERIRNICWLYLWMATEPSMLCHEKSLATTFNLKLNFSCNYSALRSDQY